MKAGLTRALPVSTIICALLFSGFFTTALGQGMGKDQSGPVTVNKTQVSVEASINPSFLPSDTSNKTLFIRAFQTGASNNNATIPRLNYRVVVILGNSTLLDQRFSSSDGVVYANLVPDQGINGWLINGQSHPPGDQIPVSQSNPVKIKSKILSSGGQYHIVATIEKGSPGLNAESDLAFDLFISVSQEYDFNVKTLSGTEGFKVRSYNDIVTDLSLVPRNGTSGISILMPFDWQSKYEPSVPLVHLEVEFPKAIAELQANSYQGTVNGVVIPQRSLLIDDFSIPQLRIVHVILPRPTLDLLSERINSELNVIHVVITPLISKPKFPIQIQSNPHGSYIFELSWGPVVIASGVQTNFVMDMINPQTGDTTGANFDFVISHNGTDVYRTALSSGIGLYSQEYAFPKEGIYTLTASNINGAGESAAINLIVQKGNSSGVSGATSSSGQPSGCLIATAAFGSELTPQVQYLRNFRDQFIMKSESGAAFMTSFNTVYYSFSPQVADYERQEPWLQFTVRTMIYPLFGILVLSEKAHYAVAGEDAGAMIAGAVASSLIGAVYLWPAGLLVSRRFSVEPKWLILAVTAAALAMIASALIIPWALPVTTSAFIIVSAAISSLFAGRVLNRAIRLAIK